MERECAVEVRAVLADALAPSLPLAAEAVREGFLEAEQLYVLQTLVHALATQARDEVVLAGVERILVDIALARPGADLVPRATALWAGLAEDATADVPWLRDGDGPGPLEEDDWESWADQDAPGVRSTSPETPGPPQDSAGPAGVGSVAASSRSIEAPVVHAAGALRPRTRCADARGSDSPCPARAGSRRRRRRTSGSAAGEMGQPRSLPPVRSRRARGAASERAPPGAIRSRASPAPHHPPDVAITHRRGGGFRAAGVRRADELGTAHPDVAESAGG